jgi:hypothetical protein
MNSRIYGNARAKSRVWLSYSVVIYLNHVKAK